MALSRTSLWLIGCGLAAAGVMVAGVFIAAEISVRREATATRAAIQAGQFAAARIHLDRWLSARPHDAEAHFRKAEFALAQNQPIETSAALARAQELGYPAESIKRLHALALARAGRYAEAEPILVQVLEQAQGNDPPCAEALARILLQTYRLRLASIVLDRWAETAPRDPRPFLWMTEIDRRSEGDPTRAIEHYRAALARDANLDAARLGLADTLRSAHRVAEAASEYDAYLKRNPRDISALVGAGRAALEHDDVEQARGYLDRALAFAPDDSAALKERAGIDLRAGDATTALARIDRALKRDPFDAEAVHTRGLAMSRLGRYDEAKAEQAKAARLRDDQTQLGAIRNRLNADPNNNDLRLKIARWMLAHGQPVEGVRWATIVLRSEPNHSAAHRILADHYAAQGDAGRANYHRIQAGSAASAPENGP